MNLAETDLMAIKDCKKSGRYEEALTIGLTTLNKLGIVIKMKPGLFTILREVNRTKRLFSIRKIRKIPFKKKTPSSECMMQLKLLTELIEPAMKINEDLWFILLMWLARLSMKKGNSVYAVIGYAGFSMISIKYLEDVEQAEELYKVTLKLLQTKDDHNASALAKYILGAYVGHSFVPWAESIGLLEEGAEDAFKVDEKIIGGYCLSYAIEMSFASGLTLTEVQRCIDKATSYELEKSGEEVETVVRLYQDFIDCMADPECSGLPVEAMPESGDMSLHIPVHLSEILLRTVMAYNQDDYEAALRWIDKVKKEIKPLKVHFIVGLFYMYEGLALTAIESRETKSVNTTNRNRIKQLKVLFEYWVKRNPYNYGQPYKMIAGCHALHAKTYDKGEKYLEQAIVLADENEAVLYKATALTLLARHCFHFGKTHMAKYYVMESAERFKSWQGEAVSRHILFREGFYVDYERVAERWETTAVEADKDVSTVAIELAEKLKGSGVTLLESFCQRISESLHSEKVLLFMDVRGGLRLKSMIGVNDPVDSLCESMSHISVKSVNQVFKNNNIILVNNDKTHELAKYDAYIMDHGVGCILAIPMAYDGTVMGVLYIERETDFQLKERDIVKRLADHVTYLLAKSSPFMTDTRDDFQSDEERCVFHAIQSGNTIKETSETCGLSIIKVTEILSGLYDVLGVDNLYEMRTR